MSVITEPFFFHALHDRRTFQLIEIQLILGSISEQQNTSYSMASMISGIGLMTERGTHLVELREEHFTQVLW
jgi:hypothetical protein